MFCIQCEQTIITPNTKGCSYSRGLCGKTTEVSSLQDILVAALQRLSFWASTCHQYQIIDSAIDRWSFQTLFATLTNVNFDPERILTYTHGEMLPAHAYPELKKYPHLVGNFGSAWQNQQREFADFPGAIVMTSNCIINPFIGHYAERIFTRSIVGWPDVTHLNGDDFSAVIQCALNQPGFKHSELEHYITIGFARNTLMNVAPAVVEQIKAGNIKHFFLIGGCDGSKDERHYYSFIFIK